MADLSPVAADTLAVSAATKVDGTGGETLTAGQVVYIASGKAMKADHITAVKAAAVGILLNNAALNQPVKYVTKGGVDLGCTLTVGTVYVVSGTSGMICPIDDVISGDFVTILGVATAADNLELNINRSGVAEP